MEIHGNVFTVRRRVWGTEYQSVVSSSYWPPREIVRMWAEATTGGRPECHHYKETPGPTACRFRASLKVRLGEKEGEKKKKPTPQYR